MDAISSRPDFDAARALLESAGLPVEDLTPAHCEHFFHLGNTREPTALVGIELSGDVALLRSLVVTASARGSGTGSRLLRHAEAYAKQRGVSRIYLLTTTAAGFFAKRGYLLAERSQAPDEIRSTREFSGICPASSTFMVKHLRPSDAVTVFHNPRCGTSRNTLGLIRNAGIEPRIIEYLQHPPARDQLASMIRMAGLTVRGAMRQKEPLFDELRLGDESLADDRLLDAMLRHPILINRPFVVSELGTRLCRPSERVLEILPKPQCGPFTKEDGEVVVDRRSGRP